MLANEAADIGAEHNSVGQTAWLPAPWFDRREIQPQLSAAHVANDVGHAIARPLSLGITIPERWKVGDEVQLWAFFKYGWDNRTQLELQRYRAPVSGRREYTNAVLSSSGKA